MRSVSNHFLLFVVLFFCFADFFAGFLVVFLDTEGPENKLPIKFLHTFLPIFLDCTVLPLAAFCFDSFFKIRLLKYGVNYPAFLRFLAMTGKKSFF
jgi:hypothetical protein